MIIKIVIVDYFKGRDVFNLLSSLYEFYGNDISISVIDNSCDNDNFMKYAVFNCNEKYPNISVYQSPENLGYSKACNMGAKGNWDYALFLNPDIQFTDLNCISKLVSVFYEDTQIGCVGVSQKNPDGSYEKVARKYPTIKAILAKRLPFFTNLFSNNLRFYLDSYDNDYSQNKNPISVDWLQSSLLIVSRLVWDKIKGFDERFFVFMADVDFGRQCKKIGFKNILIRDLYVKADGLRSSSGGICDILSNKIVRIHIRDSIKYYLKYTLSKVVY